MNPVPPTSQNPTPLSYFGETNEQKKIESRCLKDFSDDQLKALSALPDRDRAREIFASFSTEDIEEHIDRVDACSLLNLFSAKQLELINRSCLTVRRLRAIFSRGYLAIAGLLAGLSEDRLQYFRSLMERDLGILVSDETISKGPLTKRLIELLDHSNSSPLLRLINYDSGLKEREENAIKGLGFEEDTLTEAEVVQHLSNKETILLSDGLFKKIFFIADRKKVKERVALLPANSIEADARRMEQFCVLRLLSSQQLAVIDLNHLTLEQALQIFPSGMEDILNFTIGLSIEQLRMIMTVFSKHLEVFEECQKEIESFEFGQLLLWLVGHIKLLKNDDDGWALYEKLAPDL